MNYQFLCSQGHRCEIPGERLPQPGGHVVCPTCGMVGNFTAQQPERSAAVLESLPGQGTAAADPTMEWGIASVNFTLGDQRVHADITIPAGPIRARVMLPVFQKIADSIVDRGEDAARHRGDMVSCKRGCAACCRQMVPISEMEAYHIRDLVARLPEPRQSEVRAQFAQATQRLAEAGLLEKLQRFHEFTREEVDQLGQQYFALHLPCPFLEEESCSIYADRPFICREYLVTSPAENCSRADKDSVRGVPLAGKVSWAIARLGETHPARPTHWILLPLALEWAQAHPEEPPPRPGPEVLREFFERLAKQ
jgi:Fe-S-cluster containining protein